MIAHQREAANKKKKKIMRAYRRFRKMATKLEDQQTLDRTIDSVLMGTSDVNQQSIEEILDEVISKVVEGAENEQRGASRLLRTEGEHWSQVKKKEVLTSSHQGQVLFHQISHSFQIDEIYNIQHISNL